MQKLTIIAIAAAAMALSACTQERDFVPAAPGETEITASHMLTRSSLKVTEGEAPSYDVLWDAPDKILVGYAGSELATFTSKNESPATEATFTGKLPEGSGDLYGIYPAASGNTVDPDGFFIIAFKNEQTAVAGSYDPEAFPSVAVSDSKNLSFQNICGLLALKVGRNDVTKIELSDAFVGDYDSPSPEPAPTRAAAMVALPGGDMTVEIQDGEPTITGFSDIAGTIVLNAPKGKETFSTDETYYMAVYPITFSYGASFVLTHQSGETERITFEGGQDVERSKVHVVPTLGAADTNGVECVEMVPGFFVATCNVGAENPEDAGGYFAWAETEPKDPEGYTYWDNYKWMDSDINDWYGVTKYTWDDKGYEDDSDCVWYEYDAESGDYVFIGDKGDGVEHKGLASYDYEDDAARAHLGGDWRTPSRREWTVLISDDFTWEWAETGYIVKSNVKGCEGNSIFLPITGYMHSGGVSTGDYGYYWLSDWYGYSDYAYFGEFSSSRVSFDYSSRYYGFSVRGVCGECQFPPKETYTISDFQSALYFHSIGNGYTIAFFETGITTDYDNSKYTDGKFFQIDVPEEIMNMVVDLTDDLDTSNWYFYFSSDAFNRYYSGDFKSGSLKVMLDEEAGTVEFEIDAIAYNNRPVRGSYSGPIEAVDNYFSVYSETPNPAPKKGLSSSIHAGINAPDVLSHHSRGALNDRK